MGFQESFKALSDPTRREILNLLRTVPLSAGELLEHFSMTGASLSHHLSILKNAGLIDDEKKGKFIFYTLNTSVLDDILNWMMSLKKGDSHETKTSIMLALPCSSNKSPNGKCKRSQRLIPIFHNVLYKYPRKCCRNYSRLLHPRYALHA